MNTVYLDTETVGLHGMAIVLQYSFNDSEDEVIIHEVWKKPIRETLELIEKIVDSTVIGFNLSFDWFHLCKLYTTFRLLNPDYLPIDIIEKVAIKEKEGRDGPCLKCHSALDLMLHARKGKYQSTMKREPIRIKKVPTELVYILTNELEKRINLPSIYFARRKDKFRPQWEIFDCFDEDDNLDPRFKDVVMSFDASTALKALVADALKLEVTKFGEISLPKQYNPNEIGYAPYALALGSLGNWNGTWPAVVKMHIDHWSANTFARQYAKDDVYYLRKLEAYFDYPSPGDDDSVLACMVAACRWRGYAIDREQIKALKVHAESKLGEVDTYYERVKKFLEPVLSSTELISLKDKNNESLKTGKIVLEKIAKFTVACENCNGSGEIFDQMSSDGRKCENCKGTGEQKSESAKRAKAVLDAREAQKEIELYNKLLITDRLHADFVIIGTLSSRMSGTGGLNTQGIKKEKRVRRAFTLANEGYVLSGGDFKSFEIVLAIAVYNDPDLLRDVTTPRICYKCNGTKVTKLCPKCKGKGQINDNDNPAMLDCSDCYGIGSLSTESVCFVCNGKGELETKIHALFGQYIFPDYTYEQILDSEGTEDDKYTRSKSGLFSQLYGGTEHTLAERLGVPIEVALAGSKKFTTMYKQVGVQQQKIIDMFCSMRQPRGIGTKVEWHEPADYIEEPVTGHKRYYTLENMICKTLFQLAEKPTEQLIKVGEKIQVIRRDRVQTGVGAMRSALFASAFALQAANMRSATNHVIQAAGAVITKRLQRNIWNLQPQGIHDFIVQPFNVHDEILCPTSPSYVEKVAEVVKSTINYFKQQVPLLAIGWKKQMGSWGEK